MNTVAPLLLGSAAVGALVSSVITLAGQRFERKARRSELLLSESVKMAMAHRESLLKIAGTEKPTFFPEQASLVQTYFVALSHLLAKGRLPKSIFSTASQEERESFVKEFQSL